MPLKFRMAGAQVPTRAEWAKAVLGSSASMALVPPQAIHQRRRRAQRPRVLRECLRSLGDASILLSAKTDHHARSRPH